MPINFWFDTIAMSLGAGVVFVTILLVIPFFRDDPDNPPFLVFTGFGFLYNLTGFLFSTTIMFSGSALYQDIFENPVHFLELNFIANLWVSISFLWFSFTYLRFRERRYKLIVLILFVAVIFFFPGLLDQKIIYSPSLSSDGLVFGGITNTGNILVITNILILGITLFLYITNQTQHKLFIIVPIFLIFRSIGKYWVHWLGPLISVLDVLFYIVIGYILLWQELILNLLKRRAALEKEVEERKKAEGTIQSLNEELIEAYDTTLEGWAKALELKDKETIGHSRRVTELSLRLAHALGIPESEHIHIRYGALLHDIGKMGIPDEILNKTDTLTAEERKIIELHPVFAYELLKEIKFLEKAVDIPYSHHEKWDGTGYPQGLKQEAIPLHARIFTVIDVWDALTTDRSYGKAWPKEKVIQYFWDQSGQYFDPKVVEVFLTKVVYE